MAGFDRKTMNTLQEILSKIPDKFECRNTTSHKFKKDIYEFFNKSEFKDRICVELGVYNGHSSYLLSNLFKQVIGFEISDVRINSARKFVEGVQNVEFIQHNLYNGPLPIERGDVFFIDALHEYESVIKDTLNCLNNVKSDHKKYFIYDDYGICQPVKKAINDLISEDKIKLVQYVGYEPNKAFTSPLSDYEGIICIES
jgi:hypothetical protein